MSLKVLSPAIFALALSTALPAMAQQLQVASQIDGIAISATTELPPNKAATPALAYCSPMIETPETAAARKVAAQNWAVTGEQDIGGLTLVSFVGTAEQGTSGSCLLGDGNIGIFRGEDLLALAYAAEDAKRGIGSIQQLDAGGLRIWDGDWLPMPLADLHLYGDDLILVRNLANRNLHCDGKLGVSNIYGLPVHLARRLLIEDGWQPVKAQREYDGQFGGYLDSMAEAGLPEVVDCSGTGFGYCSFSYSAEGGATLAVTTAGEATEGSTPAVVGYGVDCDGRE